MPGFQKDFPPGDFIARRNRLMDAIGEAVAIVRGALASRAFELFRQSNEFYYLCGVEVPQAYLRVDGAARACTLYLPCQDEKSQRTEGRQWCCDDAEPLQLLTGLEAVRPLDALVGDIGHARQLYVPFSPAEGRQMCRDGLLQSLTLRAADPLNGELPPEQAFVARLRATFPEAVLHDLSPVLDRLRITKSWRELELMRRSAHLTAQAIAEAMRSTAPGIYEYQLSAVADFVFTTGGAQGAGYRAIVASGSNAWNAHYFHNNCRLQDGDLVLMDYAPDLGYYTSDIGRMWPVNGRYSPLQRELYGFVVEYHKTLLRTIRSGLSASQVHADVAAQMTPVIESRHWSKPVYKQAAQNMLKYTGHLSHGVGMAVHEAGDYQTEPLAPGIVFALDPQMWVPEEQLYIRVEDTVAVTESGVEVLTAAAPLELDDVERHMRDHASGVPRSTSHVTRVRAAAIS